MSERTTIFYYCPDRQLQSAGFRLLYRHVAILCKNRFRAAILHKQKGFRFKGGGGVPIRYIDSERTVIKDGDIIVVPEGFPDLMKQLQKMPVRVFVIGLSWLYIFRSMEGTEDWRDFGVERVFTVQKMIGDLVHWTMGLPVDVLDYALDFNLYRYDPSQKQAQILYIERKSKDVAMLQRMLHARDPRFTERITWKGVNDLSEAAYAETLCQSAIFLNLSHAEAAAVAVREAMAAGTIVAGYNSVGGREFMREGPQANCILAPNNDFVSLGYKMEPLLRDLLVNDLSSWQGLIENGLNSVAHHTEALEERSVIGFWRRFQKQRTQVNS